MILRIRGIDESSVYQGIFKNGRTEGLAEGRSEGEAKGRAEGEAKGRAEGATEEDRSILLALGRERLGAPDERVQAQITALTAQEQLHKLLHRLLHVSTWDELLASVDP
jgi:flagellar biosynthesis/type III secretory pathway protein FliH